MPGIMLALNERQERFALAVAGGMPPYQAYKAAGYSGESNGAYVLIKNPRIAARIEAIRDEQNRRIAEVSERSALVFSLTKQWVIGRLQESAMMGLAIDAKTKKPAPTFNLPAANRALELLGREIGMFIDRKELGRPGDFAGLSDEELEARLMRTLIDRGLSEEQARILVARQRVRGGMLDPAKRLEPPAVTDIEEAVEDEAASARIGSGDDQKPE